MKRTRQNNRKRMAAVRNRFRYWIFKKEKHCKGCCIWCKYYKTCREDMRNENAK